MMKPPGQPDATVTDAPSSFAIERDDQHARREPMLKDECRLLLAERERVRRPQREQREGEPAGDRAG